jgi:hypothetical protein
VRGNHDNFLLQAARQPEDRLTPKQREYLDMLGGEREEWIAFVETWPVYLEADDFIMVHAGLEPGKKGPAEMSERFLMQIRTWDGQGLDLDNPDNPPWFACVETDRTVVFGHWAKRGLVDLPGFKGLDTGCVYGGKLTGWCPEEDRFLQVPAKRAYAEIHLH